MKPILITAGIILGLIALIQLVVCLILTFGFHRRSDNDPKLKYFTGDDFPELGYEAIEFSSGHNILKGFIYYPKNKRPERLLMFMMGIGAGHHAYMHVIRDLALHDYQVLAFDYTGSELSGGKYINGLPQPLLDIKEAFRYIETRDDLKLLPLDVIGHSWGGYVAGVSPLINNKIRRVVSISGFNSVAKVLTTVRPYMKLFGPFIDFANYLKFGKFGLLDIATAIKKCDIPMLYMAGAHDPFVRLENNFDKFRILAKDKAHIEFYLDSEKNHNPYLTSEAEAYFIKILKEKRNFDKNPESIETRTFYQSINYDLITRNDLDFFKVIYAFLDR